MTRYLLLLYGLLIPFVSFSQEFKISGYVKDNNNQPIAYANVVLIVTNENPEFGDTTDDSGKFLIDGVSSGNYKLKVSFLGYKEFLKDINLESDVDLGTMVLEESLQELDGVTIVTKKPTVKRMVDRLVFNVENSTISNDNVLEVLKYTPGVLIVDDKIKIKNSTPTVYINDKKVHLSSNEVIQLLEGTNASGIKSIEVITNPPAKYEAEGGAVLNIVTSKNIISGYNGSAFGNYKQGHEFPKYSFGTSHFFKTNKLNTYLNYSISPRKDFSQILQKINFIENGNTMSTWESDFEKVEKSANQNINANIDYEINANNLLSFSALTILAPRNNSKTTSNAVAEIYNSNQLLDSTQSTLNKKVNETINTSIDLNYVHKFKEDGEKITVSLHHTDFDDSSYQDVSTTYLYPGGATNPRNNKFQTFTSQEIKLYTGQVDYELQTGVSGMFESGLKFSSIDSDNILTQYDFDNGVKVEDLDNSDQFLYDEKNYASYVSYSQDWDDWSLKTGLRFEYTEIMGNSISTGQTNKSNYAKLFPSLSISKTLNDKNELYLNYSRRIYRPRYSLLNPFKYFFTDNSYIVGDPKLVPQIDDTFTLGYTFNNNYTFEFYYRNENNPILEYIYQDNDDNLLIYKRTNLDQSISYGLDFITYKQILNWWTIYSVSSIFYYENNFFTPDSSSIFTTDIWSFYTEINNYLSLLKDKTLTTDVSFVYSSPTSYGPERTSSSSSLNINIKKTFWNNRASLNLGVTDVFNNQNYSSTIKYLNQDNYSDLRRETRLFVLGFNYKFGNVFLKNRERHAELEERNRLD
ncbi:outer membrane beta-barrel family protein [Flavobacteriaceae bacterium SZ-1-7]|uniref:outer membrane beta-barrel protein n=1 Tax=Tamlana sedimenti TaxID=3134126 RepID=UPI00312827D2